jgi:hypothetical protein
MGAPVLGRGRGSGDDGVVATEFIVLFPVFSLIVFGMIWAGTTLFRYQNLENAAREGARYGATLPTGFPSDSDTGGTPDLPWFEAIADKAAQASVGSSTICVAYRGLMGNATADGPGGTTINQRYDRQTDGTVSMTSGAACFPDGRPPTSRRVQVRVEAPVPMQGFGFFDGTLRGTATAIFEAVYPAE